MDKSHKTDIVIIIFVAVMITTLVTVAVIFNRQNSSQFPVPDFSLTDQNNENCSAESLRGHVWVANFIYTQCTSACPLMTAKMTLLQGQIDDPNVRFISFSVDPKHDTTEVLAAYARQWNPEESRWRLLHTDPSSLNAIATGMRVITKQTDKEKNLIIHSDKFFLIDQKGTVRKAYATTSTDMKLLVSAVAVLTSNNSGAAVLDAQASGAEIYETLNCANCHVRDSIAPSLAGVAGRNVILSDGGQIKADDVYLRESIMNPSTHIVQGFLELMPSYRDHLSAQQLDRLVAHLHTMKIENSEQVQATSIIADDPVCDMKVRVTTETPQAKHDGKSFYFCCDYCQESFVADPKKFIGK